MKRVEKIEASELTTADLVRHSDGTFRAVERMRRSGRSVLLTLESHPDGIKVTLDRADIVEVIEDE